MTVVQLLTQSTGGPCDHAVDVALELHRRGRDCLVVLPDGPAASRLDAAGVRRHREVPTSARDARGTVALLRALRAAGPSVLHCQDRRAGLVGRLAGRALGLRRTVYTLHGVPDSLSGLVRGNLQVRPRERADGLRYLRTERLLAGVGGGPVVVPSRALGDYVTRHVGVPAPRVHVVPNGVDVRHFAPAARQRRDGRLDVVWLGAVVPTKRLDVLLRAAAPLEGVHVRLGGTGELEQPLRRLVDDLGSSARVEWLGWVDDPAPLLATADALVLPSGAENLPLVVLQAMAAGCAVVASAVGGLPEAVSHDRDGLLVPPGDVHALRAALVRLRDDAPLRDRLGRQATATAQESFGVGLMVDRLLEVYA